MGTGKRRTGVEIHNGTVRINFRLAGKLHRKSLGIPPTQGNLDHAARLAAEIRERIKRGSFRWSDYWPDSAPASATTPKTFLDLARQYLAACAHLERATRQSYRQILNAYWIPWLGNCPIDQITYGQLARLANEREWRSQKTRTNAIGPLRAVFELALLDGLIPTNPAARLRARPAQKPPPDPFTADEMHRLLAWIAQHRPAWHPYFAFAFATGLRTSEQIALTWGRIDWPRRTARIERARVRHQTKGTKTATVRDIELIPAALESLEAQKPATYLRAIANPDDDGGPIFIHPATRAPLNDDKPPRLVLTDAMRATGIRHRSTYNTRHTFATLALAAGANPLWVSRQLGHSSPTTTFRFYARWIDPAASQAEAAKLAGTFTKQTPTTKGPPRASQKQ